jgi:hypothetical protein
MRVWTRYPLHDEPEGAAVLGDGGYVVIGNDRWRAFDERGEQISEETGGDHTAAHVRNFLDCMRSREAGGRRAAGMRRNGRASCRADDTAAPLAICYGIRVEPASPSVVTVESAVPHLAVGDRRARPRNDRGSHTARTARRRNRRM